MVIKQKIGSAFLGALFLVASAGLLSAAPVTVGTPDNGNCYPFMCNDSGTSSGESIQYQQVYSSSAFSGPIDISSLTFYYATAFGGTEAVLHGNYDISLSTTSKPVNGLSTTLSSNIGPDNATFFDGALGGPYTNSFTISGTPFSYNPANGNLLVNIVVTNQDNVPNGTGNGYNEADDSGSMESRAYMLVGRSGVVDSVGLVTTFNATATPEPSSASTAGMGMLVLLAGAGLWYRRSATRKSA